MGAGEDHSEELCSTEGELLPLWTEGDEEIVLGASELPAGSLCGSLGPGALSALFCLSRKAEGGDRGEPR